MRIFVFSCGAIGILWLAMLAVEPLQAHEPPQGLLAHLKFDGTLADATGNGFGGVAIGPDDASAAPRFAPGKYGQSLRLDGESAVLVPLDLHFEQYSEVTITGWILLDNDDAQGALIGTGAGDGPELRVNAMDLYGLHPGGRVVANKGLRAGRWLFFAGTWDYRTGTMRLNWRARSRQEPFKTDNLDPPGQDVFIGAVNEQLNRALQGARVDDIRIYGRKLTDDELVGLRLGPVSDPERVASTRQPNQPAQIEDQITTAVGSSGTATDQEIADSPQLPVSGSTQALADSEMAEEALAQQSEFDSITTGADRRDAEPGGTPTTIAPQHTVIFDGTGSSGRTRYTLRASGPLEPVDGEIDGVAVSANDDDTLDGTGTAARGYVGTARDGYLVYGDILSIELQDPSAAAVFLDGVRLDDSAVGGSTTGPDDEQETSTGPTVSQLLNALDFDIPPSGDVTSCGGFASIFNPLWRKNRDKLLELVSVAGPHGGVCNELGIRAASYAADIASQSFRQDTPCRTPARLQASLQMAAAGQWEDARDEQIESLECAAGFLLSRIGNICAADALVSPNLAQSVVGWYNNWLTNDGPASLGPRAIEVGQENTGTLIAPGNRRWFTPTVLQAPSAKIGISRKSGKARVIARVCTVNSMNEFTFVDELTFDSDNEIKILNLDDVKGHFVTVFLQSQGGIVNTGRTMGYSLDVSE